MHTSRGKGTQKRDGRGSIQGVAVTREKGVATSVNCFERAVAQSHGKLRKNGVGARTVPRREIHALLCGEGGIRALMQKKENNLGLCYEKVRGADSGWN